MAEYVLLCVNKHVWVLLEAAHFLLVQGVALPLLLTAWGSTTHFMNELK